MKTGRSIQDLAGEIERMTANKRDFIADTDRIAMLNGKELVLEGQEEFGVNPLAHNQIGEAFGIPRSFYLKLQEGYPTLLDQNVNTLFHGKEHKARMVRVLDGRVRAFLSDRYRRLDNYDLLNVAFPIFQQIPDVEFVSAEITDNRLYLKAVTPRIQGEVKVGDVVQNGVVLSNSEVGMGSLQVQRFIYRLVCTNGMITDSLMTKRHVGARIGGEDLPLEIFKEDTLRADDQALFLTLRDLIMEAVSEASFAQTLAKMRLASQSEPMADVSAGVKVLANRFDIQDQEAKSILHHLALGGDLTKYGALNAVTRASSDVKSYDRATELEEVGGKVLALTAADWGTIAHAGATN